MSDAIKTEEAKELEDLKKELEGLKIDAESLLEEIIDELSKSEIFDFMKEIRRARSLKQIKGIIAKLQEIKNAPKYDM